MFLLRRISEHSKRKIPRINGISPGEVYSLTLESFIIQQLSVIIYIDIAESTTAVTISKY
jgi:hypothetical protein